MKVPALPPGASVAKAGEFFDTRCKNLESAEAFQPQPIRGCRAGIRFGAVEVSKFEPL
jgi:hypothetical protein